MFLDRLRLSVSPLAWIAVVVAGCAGPPPQGEQVQSMGAAGRASSDGGAAGGADGAAVPGGDGSTHAVLGQAPAPATPPGVALTSESATSSGVSPCAMTPLRD